MRSDDDRSLFGDDAEEVEPEEGVRITGATQAGEDPLADWRLDAPTTSPELPHWTDEPTGQIPASLIRQSADEPSVAPPVWREDDADWWADEVAMDPILLGTDDFDQPKGALRGHDVAEENRPWEFDEGELPIGGRPAAPMQAPDEVPQERAPWDLSNEEPFVYEPKVAAEPRRRGGRSAALRPEPLEELDTEPRERTASPRRARSDDDGGQGRGGRDMRTAVVTGIVIAVLLLVALDVGTILTMLLVTVTVTLAAAEGFAAFRRASFHPATLLGLAATVALLVGTYNRGPQALGLVLSLLFVFTILWFMAGVERADAIKGVTSTLLVFVWVGVLGSYAALLLNPNLFPNNHGLRLLIAAIILVVAQDVVALFVGRSMGKRPLAPTISPHKTVEGLIGATVATLLLSVIVVANIKPWTMSSALCLGVATSVLSPLGDLAESMFKRSLGLKDMGRLLPGHGGLLDRVDGLLFVLPATYYIAKAFHLG